jgi:N-terminal domain on NACHT_NTPase and P-loop NTPases
MDPLSISASVLTVLVTVRGVLHKVKLLREAPKEIDALANEISDLELVIRAVDTALREREESATSRDGLAIVSKLLNRANEELLELGKILHEGLIASKSSSEKTTYRRFRWPREKERVEMLLKRLLQIRVNLSTSLNAAIS